MSALREAAQQALEALETLGYPLAAITALRAALAQQEQEQEPVAWRWVPSKVWHDYVLSDDPEQAKLAREHGIEVQCLYTHPPRREWQSLSEEEIDDLSRTMVKGHKSVNWLTRAVEAALKEKNNG
jgi:hypothetical protein